MEQYDYILVGQGLAGTILARSLELAGKSVLLVDDPSLSQASRVAAGLYNPVIPKRMVKSWMIDSLLPAMDAFYTDAEQLLQQRFYFKKEIVKIFGEEQEKALWLKKCREDIGRYLSDTIREEFLADVVYNPYGASTILHAGNVDTKLFLSAFRAYFKGKGTLLEERFEPQALQVGTGELRYKNAVAAKLIFCEGFRATGNPWFPTLPFSLVKGEIITIRLKEGVIPDNTVINKGVFILPLGDNMYRVGATYAWADLTERPTAEAKAELMEKLEKVIRVPYEVLEHQAGVRPAVQDRRPLIGLHKEHPELGIFNGLGTKGVMLAPYFAQRFRDFLLEGVPLDKEVDCSRSLKRPDSRTKS